MKVSLSNAELNEMEARLTPETWDGIKDKILASSIPKGKNVPVTLKCSSEHVQCVGRELSETWAITPMTIPGGVVRLHRTKKNLVHRPSGLAGLIGHSQTKILSFWASLPEEMREELEEANVDKVVKVKGFSEAIREFTATNRR